VGAGPGAGAHHHHHPARHRGGVVFKSVVDVQVSTFDVGGRR
jgi:hypothetical protein